MQILWTLYRAFFMIGALTFGGGYAMLPMLEREIVAKHKWATPGGNSGLLCHWPMHAGHYRGEHGDVRRVQAKGNHRRNRRYAGRRLAVDRHHYGNRRGAYKFHGCRLGAACLCGNPCCGLRADRRQRDQACEIQRQGMVAHCAGSRRVCARRTVRLLAGVYRGRLCAGQRCAWKEM